MKNIRAAFSLRSTYLTPVVFALVAGPAAAKTEFWIDDAITGCAVWSVEKPRSGEGVSWSGSCEAGKASGHGTLVFWDEAGLQGRYMGEMRGGKLHGEGRLFLRDVETGGFDQYLGRFVDGKTAGTGFLTTASGARFYGELIDGVRHGKGTLLTREGWLVRGEFKDGQGVGTLLVKYTTEEGETYFGQVENGKRHGFGTLTATDDDFYAGGFVDGLPSGPGIYKGTGGDRFIGEFSEGRANGFGTAIDPAGNVVQGRFVNGVPDGTVLVTEPDGAQSVTTWKAGGEQ